MARTSRRISPVPDQSQAAEKASDSSTFQISGVAEYAARQRLIDALTAQQREAKARLWQPLMSEFRTRARRSDQLSKTMFAADGKSGTMVAQLKRRPAKSLDAALVARLKGAGVNVQATPGALTINAPYLKDAKLLNQIKKLLAKADDIGIVPEDFFVEGEASYEVDDAALLRLLRSDKAPDDLTEAVVDLTFAKVEVAGNPNFDAIFATAKATLVHENPVEAHDTTANERKSRRRAA